MSITRLLTALQFWQSPGEQNAFRFALYCIVLANQRLSGI